MTSVDVSHPAPSVLLTDAEVHSVRRLSPAFVRIELASPAFADLGEDGYDTRFKIILPGPTGRLPTIPPVAEDFYAAWLGQPDDVRSPMRTYTIRDVVRDDTDGGQVRLVVDFVVHEDTGHGVGPACRWAGGVVAVLLTAQFAQHGGGTHFVGTAAQGGFQQKIARRGFVGFVVRASVVGFLLAIEA